MAEAIRPQLLDFLTASGMPLSILVVEGSGYLPQLRRMFPAAALYAVAAEVAEADSPEYLGLDVHWEALDYRETVLPFPRESFDYILSDLALEQVVNPQDTAAGFGTYLKPTGAWLTSFRNIRHWSVLKKLMDGHYYGIVSRLYAKPEFENLLYASFYKDVRMRPQRREAADDVVRRLAAAGFDNTHDDMDTEFWLVWAARSMPELALLKSMYTPEVRSLFSRIVHRIEYDVDAAAQCRAFWELYGEAGLFPDYAAAFIKETVFHPVWFYRRLGEHTPEGRRAQLAELWRAARAEGLDEDGERALAALLGGAGDRTAD